MADINVLVTVDTENLTAENVNTTVVLSDDNDDTDDIPGDSSTFDIIKAGGGVSIQWTPESKNGTDSVSITGINKVTGDDVWDVEPSLESGTDMWLGSLISNYGDTTYEMKYDIVFEVSNRSGESFILDPKIKVPAGDPPPEDDNEG
ncbi:MAG: hypothetical protein R8G66_08315 [Cytophagales bacterium]|nr:hypothetical protein [Cytophagales bacterium]